MRDIRIQLLLTVCILSTSCSNHWSRIDAGGKETLIPSSLTFISSGTHYTESLNATLLRPANALQMEDAVQNEKDSVDLYIETDSLDEGKKPLLPNRRIRCFPLMKPKALNIVVQKSLNYANDQDSLPDFDFGKVFALVVSHPPALQNAVYAKGLSQVAATTRSFCFPCGQNPWTQAVIPLAGNFGKPSFTKYSEKTLTRGIILHQDILFFSLKS